LTLTTVYLSFQDPSEVGSEDYDISYKSFFKNLHICVNKSHNINPLAFATVKKCRLLCQAFFRNCAVCPVNAPLPSNHGFLLPISKSDITTGTFFYPRTITAWNNVPSRITEADLLAAFKGDLEKFFSSYHKL